MNLVLVPFKEIVCKMTSRRFHVRKVNTETRKEFALRGTLKTVILTYRHQEIVKPVNQGMI